MNPERHAKIKEIFLAACDLPADQREEFLKSTCGKDDDLQERVEQLLKCNPESVSRRETANTVLPEKITYRNFSPGAMIANRYRIVDLLGRGGMGEVYRAEDTRLGLTVALKFLPADFASHPDWLARMYQEVRSARQVTHPNVCRTFDITEADGDHFISMEYVPGENIKSLLRQIGRFPQDKALDISRQICAGLAAAHARGVLHRDLKPANIMLDDEGRVKITDFGLAGTITEIHPDEIRSGTPAYMAPEQLTGKECSVQSDIYALGLVLYELYTGRPAFQADTMAEFARQKEKTQPSAPSSIIKNLDPEVERVILNCLNAVPQNRPASVLAVAAELPGGDLLSAALAAGQILSPDLIASVEKSGELRPALTIAGFALFLFLLLSTILLSPVGHPFSQAQATKSPQILADKAHQLVENISPGFRLADDAFGFVDHLKVDFFTPLPDTNAHFCYWYPPGEVPVEFWFRAGSHPLVPSDPMNVVFTNSQVGPADPKPNQPGTVNLVLNLKGNLLGFEAVPDLLSSPSSPAPPPDWSAFFSLAGLDEKKFKPASTLLLPRVWTDRRQAWVGKITPDSDQEIRVEAGVFRNHPVFFAVVRHDPGPSLKSYFMDPETRRTSVAGLRNFFLVILVLVSLPLTRINLVCGRSDPRGAFRLAALVFLVRTIVWFLQTHFISPIGLQAQLFALELVGNLAEAVLVYLFYMALEPFIRQFWPQSIISWSRLLTGKIRDPLIGQNILLGSILGVFWALIFQLDRLITPLFGLPVREPIRSAFFYIPLLGPRPCVAFYLDTFCEAIYEGLLLLLIIALLRALLHRSRVAGILAALLIAPLYVPFGSHPLVSWILIGGGCVGLAVWGLIRFGLVPIVTAVFLCMILLHTPLTLNMKNWFADVSLFALFVTLAVGLFGFVFSRSRNPLN